MERVRGMRSRTRKAKLLKRVAAIGTDVRLPGGAYFFASEESLARFAQEPQRHVTASAH